jgi:hypothetical protein
MTFSDHARALARFVRQHWLELALLALLLALLCMRVWALGVTHTDDGMWVLRAHTPEVETVAQWAHYQGRLWAYVSGSMILHALTWQGTLYGELLRIGGFVLFFCAFHLMAGVYCGKRVALLCASLFLGLFALKWDGSILTTYPLITWVAGCAFVGAALAGRRYVRAGGVSTLAVAALVLLFSLFNNEGVTITFIALFALSVVANRVQLAHAPRQRSVRLALAAAASVLIYAVLYLGWRQLYPSGYPGHAPAPFNLVRIGTTLYHFSTSGSALHELFAPLHMVYGDAYLGTGRGIDYGLAQYADGLAGAPLALLAGASVASLLWRQLARGAGVAAAARGAVIERRCAVAGGLVIALLPILPVALMGMYQQWVMMQQVRAYSHTVFAYFGWSLALAGLLAGACARLERRRYYRAVVLLLAIAGAALAALVYRANDAIAADMRPESGRWHMVDRALAANAAAFHADTIWIPALASGSQYGVMYPQYWGEYVKARFRVDTSVSARIPDINDQVRGIVMHDFAYDRAARQLVSLWTGYRKTSVTGPYLADRIALEVGTPRDYLLEYADHAGAARRVPVASMRQVGSLRVLDGLEVDPASVRLLRLDGSAVCVNRLPRGLRIDFKQAGRPPHALDQASFLDAGWHGLEPGAVWSKGRLSHIRLPRAILPPGSLRLALDLTSYTGMGFRNGTQTLRASVDGVRVGEWKFVTFVNPPEVSFVLPAGAGAGAGTLDLMLEVDAPQNPRALGIDPNDERELGVLLRALTFYPMP